MRKLKEGDWKADNINGKEVYHITVDDGKGYVGSALGKDNAMVMAASKDMLETLKVVKRWMPKNPVRKSEKVILQKINDALEKAGELV